VAPTCALRAAKLGGVRLDNEARCGLLPKRLGSEVAARHQGERALAAATERVRRPLGGGIVEKVCPPAGASPARDTSNSQPSR